MSDQQRKQGEGYESLDDLFDQQLAADLLGGSRNLEPEPEPEPARRPSPTAPARKTSDGGYGPLITQKEREIAALEKKVEGFRSADSAYIYTDEEGNKQFDHSQHRADEITLNRLNRELNMLLRRRDEAQRNAESQSKNAYRVAKRLLEERVKKLPQKYHKPVVSLFGEHYKEADDQDYWAKREFQDMSILSNTIGGMLDTVIGRVMREDITGGGKAPEASMSADDYQEPENDGSQDEDDDFTQQVMYAHEQRKAARGKTIGQIRREQAERKRKEREQG